MQTHDFEIYRGDTTHFKLKVNGVDLSTIDRIDLHAVNKQNEHKIELSTTDNSILVEDNSIYLLFNPEKHKNVFTEKWNYDLQLTFNNSVVKTILKGKIKVEFDYTKVK